MNTWISPKWNLRHPGGAGHRRLMVSSTSSLQFWGPTTQTRACRGPKRHPWGPKSVPKACEHSESDSNFESDFAQMYRESKRGSGNRCWFWHRSWIGRPDFESDSSSWFWLRQWIGQCGQIRESGNWDKSSNRAKESILTPRKQSDNTLEPDKAQESTPFATMWVNRQCQIQKKSQIQNLQPFVRFEPKSDSSQNQIRPDSTQSQIPMSCSLDTREMNLAIWQSGSRLSDSLSRTQCFKSDR